MKSDYNRNRVFTGDSSANTEKTHTVAAIEGRQIHISTLAVSISGNDISADAEILIKDDGVTVWKYMLRSDVGYGGFFNFDPVPIPVRDGDLTIVTGEGGSGVVITISITYQII